MYNWLLLNLEPLLLALLVKYFEKNITASHYPNLANSRCRKCTAIHVIYPQTSPPYANKDIFIR